MNADTRLSKSVSVVVNTRERSTPHSTVILDDLVELLAERTRLGRPIMCEIDDAEAGSEPAAAAGDPAQMKH
jgi:hypothetical protein